jgi:hypothetical protein
MKPNRGAKAGKHGAHSASESGSAICPTAHRAQSGKSYASPKGFSTDSLGVIHARDSSSFGHCLRSR